MFIGIKNGNIVAFSKTRQDLALNAKIKNVILDYIDYTEEEIVPSYNTVNDGIYYKRSECPAIPNDIANGQIREQRRELYSKKSDPITNEISVLRDQLEMSDFDDDTAKQAIVTKIHELYEQRESVRQKIVEDYPLIRE